ncbi:MAG: TetR/AcrR family transcriptional regulator [Anaerolineales bacterium]
MEKSNEGKDRRIRRTRRALRDALMGLILERDFDAITIQEITDRADLNRATFYLHYKDKQDLLFRSMQEIFDDLAARMKPPTGENFRIDVPPEGAVRMFEHIAENADFYRVALGEKGLASFLARVRAFLYEVSRQRLLMLQPDRTQYKIPLEVAASHSAGAIIGMTTWWLNSGIPLSPEIMASHTLALSAMGTYWSIGIAPPAAKKNAPPGKKAGHSGSE